MTRNQKQETRNKKPEIDIDYVAKLANLPLTPQEKKVFAKQLTDILDYFSQLSEVKTESIELIDHITGLVNIQREDQATPSITQKDALANAPKTNNGFFEVDAIFEEQ